MYVNRTAVICEVTRVIARVIGRPSLIGSRPESIESCTSLYYEMPAGFIVDTGWACVPPDDNGMHSRAGQSPPYRKGVEVGEGYTTWYSMLRRYYYYALDHRSMLVC